LLLQREPVPIAQHRSASVVAVLLLAFFFLPLPVSRVRQPGLVQIQPDRETLEPFPLPL
jgi:hypothetical protein